MRSHGRAALLSALPASFNGRSPNPSALRGPVPTLQRPPPPPVPRLAGRAASSSARASTASPDSSSPNPAVAAASQPQGPVPTTVSRCTPETVQGRHLFEIAGYSLTQGIGVGKFVQSATFPVGGYDWCIRFYPDGNSDKYPNRNYGSYEFGYSDYDEEEEEEDDDEGYLSVFLALISKGVEARALFDLRLVNPSTRLVSSSSACSSKRGARLFSGAGSTWGYEKFKHKSELELEASEYLQDDCLVIQCDVSVVTAMPVSPSKTLPEIQLPPSNLLDGLQKFLGAKRPDVAFKVQGEVFHAHKFVLAMRSSVFESEFCRRNNQQCITIEDMEPAAFKGLLHFIYTDSLPTMDDVHLDEKQQTVKGYLVAANRYGMERMKLLCESIL